MELRWLAIAIRERKREESDRKRWWERDCSAFNHSLSAGVNVEENPGRIEKVCLIGVLLSFSLFGLSDTL